MQVSDNESLDSCEPNCYDRFLCDLPGNNGYANGSTRVTDVDFSEDTEHSESSSVKRSLIVDLPV